SHLSIEMLKTLTHSYVVHVPYPSSPAAVTSVIQGDTQITSLAPLAVMPQVQAGKLKVVAVSTAKRIPQLPNVPTLRESGVPMDGSAWIGLVAPAGTPAPIIERLNREFVAAMRDPATVEKLRAQYMEPDPGTPAQFAAVVAVAAVAANAEVGTHGDVGGTPQGAQAQGKTFVRPSWASKNVWSSSYNPLIGFESARSREQVRADLMSGREALLAHEGR